MQIRPLSSPAPVPPARTSPAAASEPPRTEAADAVRLSPPPVPALPSAAAIRAAAATAAASAVAAAAGPAAAAAVHEGLKTGFVDGYMEPASILEKARDLQRRYPDLVEIVERPYRTPGYDGKKEDLRGPAPLYYLRLGPRQDPDRDGKVGVMQLAAPHAREWVPPMVMMELAEQLLANYDPKSQDPAVQANTRLLDTLDVYLLPMTNPDGANYSFHDDPMWRKTRSQQEGGVGVDVNRNFGYCWAGGPEVDEETFPGPRAFSEPETRHIAGMVEDHPNIKFVVDWHSYAQEVRRPKGLEGAALEYYESFQKRVADAIGSVRGTEYKVVESPIWQGASDDYFHSLGVFASLVEIGTEFQPPQDEALNVMRECVAGAREFLEVAEDYAAARRGAA